MYHQINGTPVLQAVSIEKFKFKSIGLIALVLGVCLHLVGCQSSIDIEPSMPVITKTPKRITLLLPLTGEFQAISQAIQDGFQAANQSTSCPITLHILDSNTPKSMRALYLRAAKLGTDLIIGPLLKSDLYALSQITDIKIPVLTLNYLDASLEVPANFYQFGLSPNDEARQAATQARQKELQSALIIVPDSTWGNELAKAFTQQWEALGGKVIDRLNYKAALQHITQQIEKFLVLKEPENRRSDFDMIFLGASSLMGRHIHPLLAFYSISYMPTYSTALIYDKTLPVHLNRDLDRIVFSDTPWNLNSHSIKPSLQKQLMKKYLNFEQYASFYALGVDAYEVASQLHQLDHNLGQSIQGASGTLTLNQERQITRQLPSAQIKQGKLSALNIL